ncbi:MAG: CvpA family protein [Acetatifactor sp.]|nr:CvpA family protein [Acetatifactor sp.]
MNILSIAAGLILLWKVVDGYKKGMVKEIISLVSLMILIAVMTLSLKGLKSYVQGELVSIILTVLILSILGIVHHLLRVIFFSAKLITKLPVLHGADKILGAAFGVVETVFVLWVIYLLIMQLDMGMIGQQLLAYTEDSPILLWLYQHNYLALWTEGFLAELPYAKNNLNLSLTN